MLLPLLELARAPPGSRTALVTSRAVEIDWRPWRLCEENACESDFESRKEIGEELQCDVVIEQNCFRPLYAHPQGLRSLSRTIARPPTWSKHQAPTLIWGVGKQNHHHHLQKAHQVSETEGSNDKECENHPTTPAGCHDAFYRMVSRLQPDLRTQS